MVYVGLLSVISISFMKDILFCTTIVKDTLKGDRFAYYIEQADYKELKNDAFSWNGMVFYDESTSGSTGYHDFPVSVPWILERVELRGDSIQDGFRLKNGKEN